MQNTLIDAGPIIALFDKSDKRHDSIKRYLKENQHRLVTTWPVLAEAVHILGFDVKSQTALLEWVARGALETRPLDPVSAGIMAQKMMKYSDVPLDLADASLIYVAEEDSINRIMTFDSDFQVCRVKSGKRMVNVLEER